MIAPIRMPNGEIRFPFKPVPPMIATANEMISQSSPVCGAALPLHDAHMIAAATEKHPDNMCATTIIRDVLIPESRAASALLPVASNRRPSTVLRYMYETIQRIPSTMTTMYGSQPPTPPCPSHQNEFGIVYALPPETPERSPMTT